MIPQNPISPNKRRAAGADLTYPPAHLGDKALIELRLIGTLWGLPDPLVEPVGVADQNAPAPGLDAIEDHLCRRSSRHGSLVTKGPRPVGGDLLNIFIRHAG